MQLVLRSRSVEDTFAIGEAIARALGAGWAIGLSGQLGGGKTHLAKGIARGLGVAEWQRVTSPTFTLLHSFDGSAGRLHHMDWYRLADASDVPFEIVEALEDADALAVVEWADLLPELLPARSIQLACEVIDEEMREFRFTLDEPRGAETLAAALSAWVP